MKRAARTKEYEEAHARCYAKRKKTPGWHDSEHRIHTFTDLGIERFKRELNAFPKKIYNQLIYSIALDYAKNFELKEYLKNSNNKEFKDWINEFEIE